MSRFSLLAHQLVSASLIRRFDGVSKANASSENQGCEASAPPFERETFEDKSMKSLVSSEREIERIKSVEFLKPTPQLLIKIGSALVHAEEFFSIKGRPHDKIAFDAIMNSEEIREWIKEGTKEAFLPVKR